MNHPLSINNIHKNFGGKIVLNGISFEVPANQIFGFVGLNGIGKTTLIKIILDLLRADQGSVDIFGQDNFLPAARRNIAYLPEKFQPSSNLQGLEFLRFVSRFHLQNFDEKKVRQAANSLMLDYNVLNLRVSKYSKGMTQKLGLMATFLSKANLIILDEPMSGLDPTARINLKQQLLDYKQAGNTIFFSSHILSDIDEICDQIAVLHKGQIIFRGTPQGFKTEQQEQNLERAFLKAIS